MKGIVGMFMRDVGAEENGQDCTICNQHSCDCDKCYENCETDSG